MSGVTRIFTPPKPNIPQPREDPQAAAQAAALREQQTRLLDQQEKSIQAETERLDKADAAEKAAARARAGRAAGRGLLLNDEIGLPKKLGG